VPNGLLGLVSYYPCGKIENLEHGLNGLSGFERIPFCCPFIVGDRPQIELIFLICADFSSWVNCVDHFKYFHIH
jgi:hypothetical protein